MTDERFGKADRLHRRADFQRVFASSVFAADEVLVVRGSDNREGRSRLGITVSRKAGNAVTRNRWKRLIREAFRRQRNRLPDGVDLVVRPRRGARPDYQAVCESLVRLASRIARQLRRRRR